MIGYQFMGRAHANAWRQVGRFFELPAEVELAVVCGRIRGAVDAAAAKLGFAEAATDWEKVVRRRDVDVVDICTPGDSHAEIAIAAAEARQGGALREAAREQRRRRGAHARRGRRRGRRAHGLPQLPARARRRAREAARRSRPPRQLHHWRGTYLQDWIVDPAFPRVWRLERARAGSGALGDIASHSIDLARHLVGEIREVSGLLETFVAERPLPEGRGMAKVDVDDAALALVRFEGGAIGTIEGTRFAPGRKNFNRFEINGSRGSLAFDLERMNELELYEETGAESGFRTILATDPSHPYVAGWWPPGPHPRLRAHLRAHHRGLRRGRSGREGRHARLRGRRPRTSACSTRSSARPRAGAGRASDALAPAWARALRRGDPDRVGRAGLPVQGGRRARGPRLAARALHRARRWARASTARVTGCPAELPEGMTLSDWAGRRAACPRRPSRSTWTRGTASTWRKATATRAAPRTTAATSYWLEDDLASTSVEDRRAYYEKWVKAGRVEEPELFTKRADRALVRRGRRRRRQGGPRARAGALERLGERHLRGRALARRRPLRDRDPERVPAEAGRRRATPPEVETLATGFGVKTSLSGHDLHGLVLRPRREDLLLDGRPRLQRADARRPPPGAADGSRARRRVPHEPRRQRARGLRGGAAQSAGARLRRPRQPLHRRQQRRRRRQGAHRLRGRGRRLGLGDARASRWSATTCAGRGTPRSSGSCNTRRSRPGSCRRSRTSRTGPRGSRTTRGSGCRSASPGASSSATTATSRAEA